MDAVLNQFSSPLFLWQCFVICALAMMIVALIQVARNKHLNLFNSILIALIIVVVPFFGSLFYFLFNKRIKNRHAQLQG
ncbi:MAG: PLDc N-terminal domain-containing protein [Sphingobacterium hotanense]